MPKTSSTARVEALRKAISRRETCSIRRTGPLTSMAALVLYRRARALGTSSPSTSSM
jgi:hypothetical protein